jgi:autotransporter-associated beta strand protein
MATSTATVANFNLTGANGILSNNVSTKAIYLIVTIRHSRPPTNVVWQGNPTTNDWQVLAPNNWLTNGVPTYFVAGDSVIFNSVGAANPNVNVVGSPAPASILVDAAANYTYSGSGSISGTGTSLTKTNSGTLTISTVNSYTGPTTIGGGILEANNLANGGNNSSIGAASASAANLVFDGGSLRYTGTSVGTDHAATLNAGGGTLDVSSAATTLTANGALTGAGHSPRLALAP